MRRPLHVPIVVALTSALILTLAACNGSTKTPTTSSYSATSVASATPTVTETTQETTESPQTEFTMPVEAPPKPKTTGSLTVNQKPQGANAAPEATGANAAPGSASSGVYDLSTEAANAYMEWITYEFQKEQDGIRSWENELYPDGLRVCFVLNQGGEQASTSALEQMLVGRGYTLSGAAGIIKGALNALCPWRNLGYQTYFDQGVQSAFTGITTKLPWTGGLPYFYEVGWFTKEVCIYLDRSQSTDGLWDRVLALKPGGQYASYPAGRLVARAGDDITLRRFVNLAVTGGCFGSRPLLGPFYTMA